MRRLIRTLSWMALQLMAFGWSGALAIAVGDLAHLQVGIWPLALGYLLPAVGRRRSGWLGFPALVLPALIAALLPIVPGSPAAAFLILLPGVRAVTVSREPWLSTLREEHRIGLSVIVLAALVAAAWGEASPWPLALLALIFLVGAWFGLPLAQAAADAGEDPANLRKAAATMRVPAVALGTAAAMALLIAIGHELLLWLPAAWVKDLLWVLWPFAYLASLVITGVRGTGLRLRFPSLPKGHRLILPSHDAVAPFFAHLIGPAAVLGLLALLALLYHLYRWSLRRADQKAPPPNTPADSHPAIGRTPRQLDFGRGPRGLVRRAVGRHLLHRRLPAGTTVRQVARQEGWPSELLQEYEHARYALRRPYALERARSFVLGFRRHLARRR